MSKLTIPAPQNIRRREAFLLAHPDYYPETKLKAELLKIYLTRIQKGLRWSRSKNTVLEKINEQKSEFVPIPKKQNMLDKIMSIFKRGK